MGDDLDRPMRSIHENRMKKDCPRKKRHENRKTRIGKKSETSTFRKMETSSMKEWLAEAYKEAQIGLAEGGLPIGAVLVDATGNVVFRGHNLRVQNGDPTAHAEVVAIRNAGRRRDWEQLTLVSTLSPCIMCTGASLLYKIKRVVVGENINFSSFAEGVMASQGVEVHLIQDSSCIEMMESFIKEKNDLWQEDIHDI